MASQSEIRGADAHQAVPSSSHNGLPIFENYLKMAKFNVPESEILRHCMIQHETPNTTVPEFENAIDLGNNNLMELDQDLLLKMLEGDSDFSETVSDFSSISISRLKRKKKRSERWRHNKGCNSEEKISSRSPPVSSRRLLPHENVNHKTVIVQHDDMEYHRHQHRHVERPKSALSSRASSTAHSTPRQPPKSPNYYIDSGIELPYKSDHTQQSRSKSGSHRSWSSKIERATSTSTDSESLSGVNRPPGTKSGYRERRTRNSEVNGQSDEDEQEVIDGYDEKKLGRNMRAVARKKSRKIRRK